MITGGNKQQRPGRSYLHGVVRDAARPFAYRNSTRRMLQAGDGSGLRAQYGNGFMPVNFKYRNFFFYGNDSLMPAAPQYGDFDTPAAAASPASRANLVATVDAPVPTASGGADISMPAQADAPSSLTLPPLPPLLAVAKATDIRIPDDGVPGRVRSTANAREIGGNSGQPGGPQAANREKSLADVKRNVKPDVKLDVKPGVKPDVKPDVVPASGPQRMPAAMSLANLARALEQHNFVHANSAAVAAPPNGVSGRKFSERPGVYPRVPGKDTAQPVITGVRSRPAIKSGIAASKPGINPVSGATTVKPRLQSARPAIPAPRAPARMEPLRRQRSLPSRRQREQYFSAAQKQQSAGGKSRNLRAPRYKPARYQRPVIVRQSAPAAFWERNYLSRLQFRMYR